jgi:hypothetical protein
MVPKFWTFGSRLIADIMATYETKYSRVMTGDLLSKIIKLPEALRDMFYLIHHHIAVDHHPSMYHRILLLASSESRTRILGGNSGLVYNQLSLLHRM